MRSGKDKLVDKKSKRCAFRNRVKDGRRLPSRPGRGVDPEDATAREKRVRAEGDSNSAFKGVRGGPLRRFLRSRVGQAWDQVYAEVCESLRGDRAGRLVLDRMIRGGLVRLRVEVVDGVPWAIGAVAGRQRLRKGELYVSPGSGRLEQYSGQTRAPAGKVRRARGRN